MDKLKSKKTIGIVIILIMVISISILTYGKNNNSIFKDKYMDNIFIEDDNKEFESGEIIIDGGENNIAESSNLNLEEKINEKESLIVVEIKGEVVNPDVYTLNEGSIGDHDEDCKIYTCMHTHTHTSGGQETGKGNYL